MMSAVAALVRSPRFWLLLAVAVAAYGAHRAELSAVLSIDALRDHREDLSDWVAANFALAVVTYMVVYVTAVALSLPCGMILTLSGGFLFGAAAAGPMAVLGSTCGAALLFLLVRALFGPDALARLGAPAARLADGIRRNAASYLLAMRFVPIFPFFIVNLVPAVVGVPLRTYVLTTFFGVMPATLVFSLAGAGLGAMLDSGEEVTARSVLTPEIMACLAVLALLTLASIPVRRWALAR
jgi:uncharacterized membrane protein YdjX (TVP38/TMEM64 family)